MTGPYAAAAEGYWEAGWRGVIPLPPRQKAPQTKQERHEFTGWTGTAGRDPSWPDVMAWAEERADGNICLHLPDGVLGLDIDDYVDPDGTVKRGGETLASGERLWGALPCTWRTTSRDNVSGIRLYRVPRGLRWPGGFGPGTETIHRGHRYAVVPPSIHPDTGRTYRWITPDGAVSLTPPRVDDLPWLPTTWVVGLTQNRAATTYQGAGMDQHEIEAWLAEHNHGDPCRVMAAAIDDALEEMRGGAHESLRLLMRVVGAAASGHDGLYVALTMVRDAFLAEVSRRRGGEDIARDEWRRSLCGAVDKIVGEMAKTSTATSRIDPCEVLVSPAPGPDTVMPPMTADPGPGSAPEASDAADAPLDDKPSDDDDKGGETPEQRRERLVIGKLIELELLQEARQRLAAKNAPPLELLGADEFLDSPVPEALIMNMLYKDSLTRIFGAPGCGKSFLSLDLAFSVALGREWQGKPVEQAKVIYVMAEGQRVNTARARAWLERHQVSRDELRGWFYAVPHKVLLTEEAIGDLVAKVAELKAGLIFFDTKNAMMLGDENSASDFAVVRRAMDLVREASDASVVLIDHTGFGDPKRARGSSAGVGAMDTEVLVENDGQRPALITTTTTRDKGDEDGTQHQFFLRSHPLEDGTPAAVLTPMGEDVTLPERRMTAQEAETAWQDFDGPIPLEVLHYDGGEAITRALPDLARYMAHDAGAADRNRIGVTQADAVRSLSEKELGKGRGHSRGTVRRAWSILRHLGLITPVEADRADDPAKIAKAMEEKTTGRHVWSRR